MKRILYLIIILGLGALYSCEKENNNPVLDLDKIVAPQITEPANNTTITLTEETALDTILFKWTPAQYNIEDLQTPSYILQINIADSSFANAKNLVSTTNDEFKISQADLNLIIINLGAQAGNSVKIVLNVYSFLVQENQDTWLQSDSTVITVNTYEGTPAEPDVLWVPGDYQGWSPADAPNIFSPAHDGKFAGYIYFPPGGTFEFKFTSAPNWGGINYGDGGDGILDTDGGAGNLSVPEEGTYYFNVDTEALTWNYELRNFALIGTFNNWEDDEPLTWDNDNWRFEITRDFEAGAEFKWRANGNWTVNLGDDGSGNNTLSQDGNNIVIETAGNYTIYLYLYEPTPRYEIVKN